MTDKQELDLEWRQNDHLSFFQKDRNMKRWMKITCPSREAIWSTYRGDSCWITEFKQQSTKKEKKINKHIIVTLIYKEAVEKRFDKIENSNCQHFELVWKVKFN